MAQVWQYGVGVTRVAGMA
jgi:hypothetical protein